MKKLALLTVVVVLILSMVGQAAALSAPSTISVGDDRERASNPLADREKYHDWYMTTTVTLTAGTGGMKNVQATSQPLMGFLADDLNITVDIEDHTTLNDGDTLTATITVRFPEDLAAVDNDYMKTAFHVATIKFTADDLQDVALPQVRTELYLERENQLKFDSILVCVNEDCERVDDGDTVNDLRPGDKVELTFSVENRYQDNDKEDLSIEDVVLEWVIDENELDEEDDAEFGGLGPRDVEEDTFSFVIDDEVTDGTYDMVVSVYGEDENGAWHGEAATIEFKVERERHDLDLRDVIVSPKLLSCDSLNNFVTFNIETANVGKTDEDEVILKVENAQLGIEVSSDELEIEESETKTTNLRVEIPMEAEEGAYLFRVAVYYDDTVLSDETEVQFIVPKCEAEPIVVEPVVPVEPEPVEPVEPIEKRVPSNLVDEFTESNAYVALLVVGIVLAMLILVFLVVRVVPPRKD